MLKIENKNRTIECWYRNTSRTVIGSIFLVFGALLILLVVFGVFHKDDAGAPILVGVPSALVGAGFLLSSFWRRTIIHQGGTIEVISKRIFGRQGKSFARHELEFFELRTSMGRRQFTMDASKNQYFKLLLHTKESVLLIGLVVLDLANASEVSDGAMLKSGYYKTPPITTSKKLNELFDSVCLPVKVTMKHVAAPVPERLTKQARGVGRIKLKKESNQEVILETKVLKSWSIAILRGLGALLLLSTYVLLGMFYPAIKSNPNIFLVIFLAPILAIVLIDVFIKPMLKSTGYRLVYDSSSDSVMLSYEKDTEKRILESQDIESINIWKIWQTERSNNVSFSAIYHLYSIETRDEQEWVFSVIKPSPQKFSISLLYSYDSLENQVDRNVRKIADALNVPIVRKN